MKNSKPSAAPAGASKSEQPSMARTVVAAGKLSKGPRLQKGNDAEVAQELGRLVRDAQDGTRRILICGLFIETIVANLKRGELGPWIEANEAEIGVGRKQIFGWRQFSTEVLKQIGFEKSLMGDFSLPLHETLALPANEVPEDSREVRAKIDELIAGKSVRQLQFQFRECEVFEDELVRTGRGGDRAAARGPRRTNAEIERDLFETAAKAASGDARRAMMHLLKVRLKTTNSPRAWDILDDKALLELKQLAIDIRDGILESEKRRISLRPRK